MARDMETRTVLGLYGPTVRARGDADLKAGRGASRAPWRKTDADEGWAGLSDAAAIHGLRNMLALRRWRRYQ